MTSSISALFSVRVASTSFLFLSTLRRKLQPWFVRFGNSPELAESCRRALTLLVELAKFVSIQDEKLYRMTPSENSYVASESYAIRLVIKAKVAMTLQVRR